MPAHILIPSIAGIRCGFSISTQIESFLVRFNLIFMPPLLAHYLSQKRTLGVLPHIQGDVLDLGCGVSRYPKYLNPDRKYVGVKINPKFIEWLKDNYPQHVFYQWNLETSKLILNSQFDTVLMIAVLKQLHNPDNILKQILSFQKPDGKLVMTTPTPFGGKSTILEQELVSSTRKIPTSIAFLQPQPNPKVTKQVLLRDHPFRKILAWS